MGFGDVEFALKFRTVIERIIDGKLARERPAPRIARVYSYDRGTLRAAVMFAGDDTPVNVSMTYNCQPRTSSLNDFGGDVTQGDVVRVEGGPGNYYITAILSGPAYFVGYLTVASLGYPGALVTTTGVTRFYLDHHWKIDAVRASVGTAPTGSTIIVDVKKNGTTIFTTTGNRPTIVISGHTAASGVPDIADLAPGDYLTVDIVQVGSSTHGSDLDVQIWLLAT